jgi:hypothetical protein
MARIAARIGSAKDSRRHPYAMSVDPKVALPERA